MTDFLANQNVSNLEFCGKIYGSSAGVFRYRCHFCADEFRRAIDFEAHVLCHIVRECIAILPDIPPLKIEYDHPSLDLEEIKTEPDHSIDDAPNTPSPQPSHEPLPQIQPPIEIETSGEKPASPPHEIANRHSTVATSDINQTISNANNPVAGNVKCECCYNKFACNGLRDLHVHHAAADFVKCIECPAFYPTRIARLEHKRIHRLSPSKQFKCTHCGRVFASKDSMVSHIVVNKKQDILPKRKHNFVRQPGRATEYNLECDICGKKFSRKQHITKHLLEHVTGTVDHHLICLICNRKCTTASNLKIHVRTHTGARPFACTICDKTYTQLSSMRVHMRSHTGEKPYVCATCGKGFSSSSKMTHHIKAVHERQRNHVCDLCGDRFKIDSLLRDHIRSKHTGERPFACDVCGVTFCTRKQLRRHGAAQHQDKLVKCNFCDEMFAKGEGRRCHERLKHNVM